MCYMRQYRCQAKHSNSLFVSAASPNLHDSEDDVTSPQNLGQLRAHFIPERHKAFSLLAGIHLTRMLVRIEPPRQWESVQRRSSHTSATRFARAKTNGP